MILYNNITKTILVLLVSLYLFTLIETFSLNDLTICGKRPMRKAKIIGGVESVVGDWGWQVN